MDRQRLSVERFGLSVVALILVESSQVVQALQQVRVIRPEGLNDSASAYLP